MADVDNLESEESINSPEAPQYSPISDTAESHQGSTTLKQDISEDEPEPQTEPEPSVSNL